MKRIKKYGGRAVLEMLGVAAILAFPLHGIAYGDGILINEIQISTAGTDWEFVEIIGTPGEELTGVTLLGIESDQGSSTGRIDLAIDLNDQIIPESGLWLGISPAGSSQYGVSGEMTISNNSFENGSSTYLLVTGFSGSPGDDLDVDDDGILDITPWIGVLDGINLLDSGSGDVTYGVASIGPDGNYLPSGVYRCPDGPQSEFNFLHNFSSPDGTPGAPNCESEPPMACGDEYTPIYAVQGIGMESPLIAESVSVEGVVVGDFQNEKGGFFLQDPDGDGEDSTSDGIYIYDDSVDVNPGDYLRVTGTVTEYYGLTEINRVTQIQICSTGQYIDPVELSLPVETESSFESYEGMLVTFPQPLNISEFYNFDRYGEVVLSNGRQFQPTAVYTPGSEEADTLSLENQLNRIAVDDGRTTQNPDPSLHPNGEIFDLNNLFRGGDLLYNVTGIMDYSYGKYVIQPTQGADYVVENPRPLQPDEVGGNIRIASFNVLNYFTTLDTNAQLCGPNGDLECRGADTDLEYERQHAKIVSALTELDADVVGLIEIENGIGDLPTETLVNGLNDAIGRNIYSYIPTGSIGSDAIRVALIYKPESVVPVGDFAVLDSSVDERFIDEKNRPALAQSFFNTSSGGLVTVAVNHFKSKGSTCDDLGDPNTGDGSGNCNITRTSAAEALVDWLATDPTGSGSEDYLILGDLNAYDKETPIEAIKNGADDIAGTDDDYTDLLDKYLGELAYSYVFSGELGYLDYALTNQKLTEKVTGAAIYHINADEPDLIDYDMSYKKNAQDEIYADDQYRSSDHDAVLVGLDMCEEEPPVLEISVSPEKLLIPNHKYVEVEAKVSVTDNFDPQPRVKLVSVTSNEPDNGFGDGNTINDIVIIDDFHFKLRAELSLFGKGRKYKIVYKAMDKCGNKTKAKAIVKVPMPRMWKRWKKYFFSSFNNYSMNGQFLLRKHQK